MKRRVFRSIGGMLFLFLTACAGPGERLPVTLSYLDGTPLASVPSASRKVVVFPLEDKRKDPQVIGQRTHIFGQVDTFESATPTREKITQLLVDSLRKQGWDAHLAAPGSQPQEITNERVVTGTLRTLWAEATSHLGYTQIEAHFALYLEALNPTTGGRVTMRVDDQSTPKVVFFRARSFQETLNDLISSGLKGVRLTPSSAAS